MSTLIAAKSFGEPYAPFLGSGGGEDASPQWWIGADQLLAPLVGDSASAVDLDLGGWASAVGGDVVGPSLDVVGA